MPEKFSNEVTAKLTMAIATNARLSFESRNALLVEISTYGISERLIKECLKRDVTLPAELEVERSSVVMYSLPAIEIFRFLPTAEIYCAHFHSSEHGSVMQLVVGPHRCVDVNEETKKQSHLVMNRSAAQAFAQDMLKTSSFGIVLGLFVVKEIDVMSNGKIIARCFGRDRNILLAQSDNEVPSNG
jgi:hypothetical protein